MKEIALSTYIINLKNRKDRKTHIPNEFSNRDEINLNVIEACEHKTGAFGLWNTIIHIFQSLNNEKKST
jgi:glycosyl transferase family 25